MILIGIMNMSCIRLLNPTHYLFMDEKVEVHPCIYLKSSLHLIWNTIYETPWSIGGGEGRR